MATRDNIVAIDFGNKNTVLAKYGGDYISVPMNSSSKRLTPTVVAFTDNSRVIGDIALYQRIHNRKNTVLDLRRLIGVLYDSKEYEQVSKHTDNVFVEMPNNKVGIDIGGKYGVVYPEQCTSCLVSKLLKEHEITSPRLFISVSPWWTSLQRRSILDAMYIAGFNNVHLVNSTLSSSVSYLSSHRNKLDENKTPMIFIDFGDSSLSVSVVLISKESVDVVFTESSNEIGGCEFTEILIEEIIKMIGWKDEQKIKKLKNKLAFQTEIERLKRNLSINSEITVDIPALSSSEEDIKILYKREMFENSISHLVSKFSEILTNAIKKSGIDPTTIVSVEALGGSSRIPIIKNTINLVISDITGDETIKVSQSLNPDECFAHGACTYGALSNGVTVTSQSNKDDFSVQAIHPVARDGMSYTVHPDSTTETIVILERDTAIAEFTTGTLEDIVISIEVDSNLIASIQTDRQVRYFGQFSKEEITKLSLLEKQMQEWDEADSLYDNLKNDLESMVYQLKGFIRDSKRFFKGDKEYSDAISAADEADQWIINCGEEKDEKTLNTHMNRLKEIMAPVADRIKGHNLTHTAFEEQLNKIRKYVNELQTSEVAQNMKDEAFSKLENIRKEITDRWDRFETADFVNPELDDAIKSISKMLESKSKGKLCIVM